MPSQLFIYNLFSTAYMRNACDLLLLGKHVALDGELGAEGTQTSFSSLPRVNLTFQLEGGGVDGAAGRFLAPGRPHG